MGDTLLYLWNIGRFVLCDIVQNFTLNDFKLNVWFSVGKIHMLK